MEARSILFRFLDSVMQILPPDIAVKIVEIRLDPSLQTRLDILAEKGNRGCLSTEEREEYAEYVEALDIIATLKIKARAAMRRAAP